MMRRQSGIIAFYKAAETGADIRIRELREDVRRQISREEQFCSRTAFCRSVRHLAESLHLLFSEEECLMIRTLYPDYEMQHTAHRYFLGELRRESLEDPENCAVCRYAHRMIRGWLRQHNLFGDLHFFRHLERWRHSHEEDLLMRCSPEHVLLTLKIGKDVFL